MPNFASPPPLTLGTASLGMAYGIANPSKKPPAPTVEGMLDQAWEAGITSFDTAPGYGEAEALLGGWLRRRQLAPQIATKLPSLATVADRDAPAAVDAAIRGSIGRLALRPAFYLTHDAADYLRAAVRDRLHEAVQRDAVGAVGLSVYTDTEVFAAIAAGPPDVVQLPLSALDRRMIGSGALDACAAAGIMVFARSIFLQGVMLMQPSALPAGLEGLRPSLTAFEQFCTDSNTTRASAALRYVRDTPGVTSTIIGAYSPDQLATLIVAGKEPPFGSRQREAIKTIAAQAPADLLDPRAWPQAK